MPAYLRIHRFPDFHVLEGRTWHMNYVKVGSHSHMPMGYKHSGPIPIDPKIVVRVDGKIIGTNTYEGANRYIDGQEIGVSWPPSDMLSSWPTDPKGPKIAQFWYDIEPGEHVFEIAVRKYLFE